MITYKDLTKKVTYDKQRSILFNSRLGKRGDKRAMLFSNFQPFTFTDKDGVTFHSTEQRYQWLRLKANPKFQDKILTYSGERNAWDCWQYVTRKHVQPILDMSVENRIDDMRDTLKYKVLYCPDFKEELIATGNETIVEFAPWGDDFWGAVGQKGNPKTITGSNVMGKLLMELREELTQGKATPVATPQDNHTGIDLIRSALSKLDQPQQGVEEDEVTPVNTPTPEPQQDVDDEDETDIDEDEEDGFEVQPLQRIIFDFGKQKIQFTSENFCLLSVYDNGYTIKFNVKH